MRFKDLFESWNLTGLKIKASFLEMEWKPADADKAVSYTHLDVYKRQVLFLPPCPEKPLGDRGTFTGRHCPHHGASLHSLSGKL